MPIAALVNLFVLTLGLSGALHGLDAWGRWTFGSSLFEPARTLASICLLLAAIACFGVLMISPLLPRRIFLPILGVVAWGALGALPLPLQLERWGVSSVLAGLQLGGFAILLGWIRRNQGEWWLSRRRLQGPRYASARALRMGLATLVFGPLLLLSYGLLGLGAWIHWGTGGFVSFDLSGARIAERAYAQGDREVWLIGMIHVGEPQAYRELFDSFRQPGTVVLSEGVSDERSLLQFPSYEGIAHQLGLEAQPRFDAWPETDSEEPGDAWPHVRNADLDASNFSEETRQLLDAVGRAIAAEDRDAAIATFEGLLEGNEERLLELAKTDLILKRNEHLFAELTGALETYRRVVIPWGALHMPGLENEVLARGFQLKRATTKRLFRYSTIVTALLTLRRDEGESAP